jgi:hypothetical protein
MAVPFLLSCRRGFSRSANGLGSCAPPGRWMPFLAFPRVPPSPSLRVHPGLFSLCPSGAPGIAGSKPCADMTLRADALRHFQTVKIQIVRAPRRGAVRIAQHGAERRAGKPMRKMAAPCKGAVRHESIFPFPINFRAPSISAIFAEMGGEPMKLGSTSFQKIFQKQTLQSSLA